MTEDEAKTKWCPFVRFVADDGATFNRGSTDPMNHTEISDKCVPRCLGSSCMVWRWRNGPVERTVAGADQDDRLRAEGWRRLDNEPAPYGFWFERQGRGFCGLAGRPE